MLEHLKYLSGDHVLIVEGMKDKRSLEALGISADFFLCQSSGGPVNAMEYVEEHGGKAVILTDWDRRGNNLADHLSRLMGRDNPHIDTSVRSGLITLCHDHIKDVESLHSFYQFLSAKIYEP